MVMDYKKAGKSFIGEFEPNQDAKTVLDNFKYDLSHIFTQNDVTLDQHKAIATFTLLEGRAQHEARKITPIGRDGQIQYSRFQAYMNLLDTMVKATQPGDVTLTHRAWHYNIQVAGATTFKRYGRVDLHAELLTFRKLIEKRTIPVDDATFCALVVHSFHTIPEIYDNIRTYQDDGRGTTLIMLTM